jgi:hypothetical protein
MTWSTNWFLPTDTAATLLKEHSKLLKNTLWQGSPLWIQNFHYICGTYFYPRPPRLTFMALWITTRHLFHRQDAESLTMRYQENDEIGHPTEDMDITWDQQCITTDVKTFTFRPRLVNAS